MNAPGRPENGNPGPLAGLRVVELGEGTAGPFAAKLLGDFGAEVVKIEPPEGDPARWRGPFPSERPNPNESGLFHYLNSNKFGIVLRLEVGDDRQAAAKLIESADIFVTNLSQERLRAAECLPADLRKLYPSLVIALITPFGATGPWSDRFGDELVTYAMGGIAYSTPGMPDAAMDREAEPPLHPSAFAAETIAGLVAASAILSAVLGRDLTGDGCFIDLSQQAAVAAMQHRDLTAYSYGRQPYNRLLNPATIGRMPNFYLPCRDGYVTLPAPMDVHWERLVEAMGKPAWTLSDDFATGSARTLNWVELRRLLAEWTMTLSGDEIYAIATVQQLPFFPFYPLRKTVESDHVRERGGVVDVEIGGRPAKMPGPPVQMRRSPWSLRRPAPRLGEHNTMLLGVPA